MTTSLELAITAIRSGRKDEGRQLLNLLIQQNPNNELAWLWMSSVVHTDQQRARCLYHVLAINPANELARRGLQLLGISVSDSRPVKVPRDSQPIPIQRPQPDAPVPGPLPLPPAMTAPSNGTGPLPLLPAVPAAGSPASQPVPTAERRPFRLDPRTITQELPFKPLREPFAETLSQSDENGEPGLVASQPHPNDSITAALTAVAVASANGAVSQPVELSPIPSETARAEPESNTNSQPPAVQPIENQVNLPPEGEPTPPDQPPQLDAAALAQTPSLDTGPLPAPPQSQPQPTLSSVQPTYAGPVSLQETRPTQPIWTTPANPTVGLPQTPPLAPNPYPAPAMHSNVTMGMPTQYLMPPASPMGSPGIHSNVTMGLPMPNGPMPYPVEPMPVLNPNLPAYGMPAYAPAMPSNPAFHSGATMAMPTMTEAEARARLMASQQMPVNLDTLAVLRAAQATAALPQYGSPAPRSKSNPKKNVSSDDDNEEEVNLLAVIVFGSLSVTALGGLGMLILLWVTSV
jgi:hypothetical protein